MFSVHLFKLDRAFGGHEEGGWWFDYGEPEDHPLNKVFRTKAEALAYRDSIAGEADRMNEGYPDIESVCCEGVFSFLINRGKAKPFPAVRPRYE
jgi:hypothetical protein